MPNITVNGTVYTIPTQGTNPPWGTDLSDAIVAIATALGAVVGPQDIATTTFNLANNTAVATNITGAAFDTSSVRAAIFSYSIYRSTASNEESEVGQLYLTYASIAATWDISEIYGGSSTVAFSITNAGQIQYTSGNLAGSSYTGKITFKATAFLQ